MVSRHLQDWEGVTLDHLEYLFIENVGNLVCPSSYDLGERIRVALLSVTEGEDKPLKYPTLFNSADAVVITKMDIAEAVEFGRLANLRQRERDGYFRSPRLRRARPADDQSGKVRSGGSGGYRVELGEAAATKIDAYVAEHLNRVFGYSS